MKQLVRIATATTTENFFEILKNLSTALIDSDVPEVIRSMTD